MTSASGQISTRFVSAAGSPWTWRFRSPHDRIVAHSLGLKITAGFRGRQRRGTPRGGLHRRCRQLRRPRDRRGARKSGSTAAAVIDEKAQTAAFSFGAARWKRAPGSSSPSTRAAWCSPASRVSTGASGPTATGAEHWAATTQFEATHARRAFPCWDEPAIKATYAVTLVIDKELTALSNMRVASETSRTASRRPLPLRRPRGCPRTSLHGASGSSKAPQPAWANGKELRIWSVPGKNALKEYALKCAAYGVEWYERTLGVPYFGGDKIDMIAIPEFRSGAMENTGLITYRATALLVDEPNATVGELQRVAEVVFHELAHMWFGNLVTMAWWDGLPLNESNATIFAYLVMADFEPEWRIFNSFATKRAAAFALDSLNSTHPCWAPVGHPDEVEQRFDRSPTRRAEASSSSSTSSLGDASFYARRARVPDALQPRKRGGHRPVGRAGGRSPEGRARRARAPDHGRVVSHRRASRCHGHSIRKARHHHVSPRSGLPSWPGRVTPDSSWPIPLSAARAPRPDGDVTTRRSSSSPRRSRRSSLQEGFQYVVANDGGLGLLPRALCAGAPVAASCARRSNGCR